MIPRIRKIEPRDNYKLFICFDDGSKGLYVVLDDMVEIGEFFPINLGL